MNAAAVVLDRAGPTAVGLVKLLRPKQWVKNGFVLAPLIFAGLFTDIDAIGRSVLAMAWFCVGSSTVYIVNDYFDIERDRQHPTKARTRPLASGQVTKSQALALLAGLYAVLAAGFIVQPTVVAMIVAYILLNIAYTLRLKHLPVVDVFTIAIGFVARVYVGALALSVPLSAWMFVTTLCLALFLATIKRRQELAAVGADGPGGSRQVLESYSLDLINTYAQMSGVSALLFYSLFVMTSRPQLVASIPFVLFGLFRYWYLVDQVGDGESPTDALLSDVVLLGTVVIWGAVSAWAVWPDAV